MAIKFESDGVKYESDSEYGDTELFSYLGRKEAEAKELKLWITGGVGISIAAIAISFLVETVVIYRQNQPQPLGACERVQ